MVELFLDGKRVVLPQTTNIKLTAENQFFTKSASYTYDVELPMGVPQNREIFGDIDRIDTDKEDIRFAAKLVVDNVTALTGEAHITSVKNESVTVQLLGETAAYNYGNKMDKLYLDTMNLGDWYWETFPDGSYYTGSWHYMESDTHRSMAYDVLGRARYKGPSYGNETYTEDEMMEMLRNGHFGWVAYPTYNAEADTRHNAIAWEIDHDSWEVHPFLREYEGEKSFRTTNPANPPRPSFSIQPFVWRLAEIVAKSTGFTIDRADNDIYNDDFLSKIFIVTTSTSAKINSGLPHWSVNEFWSQIEDTFGVVMSLDYDTGRMRLKKRVSHYSSAARVALKDVLDDFESTMEDETNYDISVSNVGFADFEGNPEDALSDEIIDHAEVMKFDSSAALFEWAREQGDIDEMTNVIFDCADGRQYIFSTDVDGVDGLIEVNMFRNRITDTDNDDVEIELKFVPAKYSEQSADIYFPYRPGVAWGNSDTPIVTFKVKMLEIPGQEVHTTGYQEEKLNIQAVLDEEEEIATEGEGGDLMYIAIVNPLQLDNFSLTFLPEPDKSYTMHPQYPRALLKERGWCKIEGGNGFFDQSKSLSLIPISGQDNLASRTVVGMVDVDTKVLHTIKFIADVIPDPGALFIIHNKKFVCVKIEASIKPEGLDKLMTGSFYRLK